MTTPATTKPGKKAGTVAGTQASLIGDKPVAQATTEAAPADETALATTTRPTAVASSNGNGAAIEDPMADLGLSPEELADAMEHGGLHEADSDDYRLPLWAFNLEKDVAPVDGPKSRCRKDQFVNVMTEQVVDELEIVPLLLHKAHTFNGKFNTKDNRTPRYCRSDDRKNGRMIQDHVRLGLKAGQIRPCKECPQKQWRDEADADTGEITRILDCNTEYNFMFLGGPSQDPGLIRLRKSSEFAAKTMMRKFYLNKAKTKDATGKIAFGNLPLFRYVLKCTLEMDPGGQFARPVFALVRKTTPEEFRNALEQVKYLTAMQDKTMAAADAQEDKAGPEAAAGAGDVGDASFDPSKLNDGAANEPAATATQPATPAAATTKPRPVPTF